MSREELEQLEDTVEAEVERGERGFWDLYSILSIKSQRLLEIYFSAVEACRSEAREREPPADYEEVLHKAGDGKNGYRIWKYHPGGQVPEDLRRKLYRK